MKFLARLVLQGILFVLLGTVAQAAVAVANQDSWTCASGTVCNHTLTFTPTNGRVLIYTSMAVATGDGSYWAPQAAACGGNQTWNTLFPGANTNSTTATLEIAVANTTTSASTTCNSNSTNSTSITGSVQVVEFTGLNTTSLPTSAYDATGMKVVAFGSHLSSTVTANITPTTSGEYPFCAAGTTTAAVSPSFTGGSLSWTTYADDTALGSNDNGFAGPYASVSAMACTYNYTGTFTSAASIILLVPAAATGGAPGASWIGAFFTELVPV